MEIAIIGAGATGLLYAHQLANIFRVKIYCKREEQRNLIHKEGVTLIDGEQIMNKKIKVELFSDETEINEDVLIITAKQYSLESIIRNLKKYQNKTILFLQNGMNHITYFHELQQNKIFVGVIEHGAKKENDTTVYLTGKGLTNVAPYNEHHTSLFFENWDSKLKDFPIVMEKQWYPILAKKLIVNAVINPLTALYKVENGKLLSNKNYLITMETIFNEAFSILNVGKKEEMWNHVTKICTSTSKNHSSMLRDMETGKKTEVDAILGYLLQEGKKAKKELPVIHFVYHALKGMENVRMNE
ncbi:2-dehydropantoate 2-reductase [Sutcliffiella cohnii]|uniref:2-dehydropantoate 2-reductase n=1 Tax=Sutcliffiella cohnii TaxID=33932 RepID=A0A223KS24_9BACI|nr:2-dehydropantoate 2-reductase [Sutcliffiella cohnii]AST92154.1 2-dehydropantoate 2-reductase [Sutcliffiella cohnii]